MKQRRNSSPKSSAKSPARSAAAASDVPAGPKAGTGASDVTAGWVTLLSGILISALLYWRNHSRTADWPDMRFWEFNMLNTTFVLGVPLVILLVFLRREPAEFGLTVGEGRKGNLWALVLFGLFLPVIVYFATQPGAQRYYVHWMSESGAIRNVYWTGSGFETKYGAIHWPAVVAHQFVMAFYMFGWEWYHRGFLLNGLRKIMPAWGAVLIQALLFGALHYGKPPVEVASSFAGGLLLGVLAIRFKSFVPCFVIHALVSAANDLAVLYFVFRR